MIAISSLLLVVAVSLLLTRVATVILTATGMSRESARFQARSALTGTGFTTKEAEEVLNHPVRRKVIAMLMLLGSAGIVAAASTTILGFRGGGGIHAGWRVLELGLGLFALVFLSRSRWVDRRLTSVISRLLDRFTDLKTRDIAGLVDLAGGYAVSELGVDAGDWVVGHTLGELGLRDEGIVVLGLTRSDGQQVVTPTGATDVRVGDLLVVYGDKEQLCALDRRAAGAAGDAAHATAVQQQQQLESAQQPRAAAAS